MTSILFLLLSLLQGDNEPRFLVSTEWLSNHLHDPSLVLLQVGTREQYDSTHIPGAHFIGLSEVTMRRDSVVFELPSLVHLDSVFESKGVSDHSRIVVYSGRDWISPTARVYMTLDYMGLGDRTFILDGGMGAWIAEGHQVTAEIPEKRIGSLTPRPRSDVVVNLAWMKENFKNPEITVIDSRNREFFTGEEMGNSVRRGHIPGAKSVPFSDLVDSSLRFMRQDELRNLLEGAGMTEEKTLVSYCHIGQQASLTYFVARYLGYDARLYDGSMSEWSKEEDLPVVTGE